MFYDQSSGSSFAPLTSISRAGVRVDVRRRGFLWDLVSVRSGDSGVLWGSDGFIHPSLTLPREDTWLGPTRRDLRWTSSRSDAPSTLVTIRPETHAPTPGKYVNYPDNTFQSCYYVYFSTLVTGHVTSVT